MKIPVACTCVMCEKKSASEFRLNYISYLLVRDFMSNNSSPYYFYDCLQNVRTYISSDLHHAATCVGSEKYHEIT